MNYHNITKDDMLNGNGLRVVLWVSGCNHACVGCQNPITWDCNGGVKFDDKAKQEIFAELEKDYVDGITFSGGDPLHPKNIKEIQWLMMDIIMTYPSKTIWVYTGYTYEYLYEHHREVLILADVLVDGKFKQELKDVNYPWCGSTNQRVIDCQESEKQGKIVLWKDK